MKSIDSMTILITGSTDGIGKVAATILAKQQARVLIHGRNPQKLSDNFLGIERHLGVLDRLYWDPHW